MSLAIPDCEVGTIVDHRFERCPDGREVLRPICRRGIIMRVDGNGMDSVTAVWVKFKQDAEPEKVNLAELVKKYPASSKPARRALRRARGESELVGAEFKETRAPVRPKFEDAMKLTAKRPQAVVTPEGGEDEEETAD